MTKLEEALQNYLNAIREHQEWANKIRSGEIQMDPLQVSPDKERIKLLDYFATHAPAVPEWFIPKMPEKPEVRDFLSIYIRNSDHPHKAFIKFYSYNNNEWQEDIEIPEDFKKYVADYISQRQKEDIIKKNWDNLYSIEYIIQWPYFYAQKMLEKREEIMK